MTGRTRSASRGMELVSVKKKAETMKKSILILLGLWMGAAATNRVVAQVTPTRDVQKEKTMKDLKNDVRAHEATKSTVGNDIVHFRVRQAFRDHQLVSRTHKMVDTDRKKAKAQGIEHPVVQARREVHAEDARVRG